MRRTFGGVMRVTTFHENIVPTTTITSTTTQMLLVLIVFMGIITTTTVWDIQCVSAFSSSIFSPHSTKIVSYHHHQQQQQQQYRFRNDREVILPQLVRPSYSTLYQEKQPQQQEQQLSSKRTTQRLFYFSDHLTRKQQVSKVSSRPTTTKKRTSSLSYRSNAFLIRKMIRTNRKQCMKTIRDTTESIIDTTTETFAKVFPSTSNSHIAGLSSTLLTNAAVVLGIRIPPTTASLASISETTIKQLVLVVRSILDTFNKTTFMLSEIICTSIMNFWYLLPSLLCFVPFYTLLAYQTMPVTPTIWKLVNMDFIWCAQHAVSIVIAFLASNATFFIAALYLLQQSGTIPSITTMNVRTSNDTQSSMLSLSSHDERKHSRNSRRRLPAALGYWVLSAGIMSTIFHSVQALGNYRIAEALCYMDHGVAGTAICYFYYTCGRPSIRTLLCGILGLITLAYPADSILHISAYTLLHSMWHTFAALTAVLWANDSSFLSSSSSITKQNP